SIHGYSSTCLGIYHHLHEKSKIDALSCKVIHEDIIEQLLTTVHTLKAYANGIPQSSDCFVVDDWFCLRFCIWVSGLFPKVVTDFRLPICWISDWSLLSRFRCGYESL